MTAQHKTGVQGVRSRRGGRTYQVTCRTCGHLARTDARIDARAMADAHEQYQADIQS